MMPLGVFVGFFMSDIFAGVSVSGAWGASELTPDLLGCNGRFQALNIHRYKIDIFPKSTFKANITVAVSNSSCRSFMMFVDSSYLPRDTKT